MPRIPGTWLQVSWWKVSIYFHIQFSHFWLFKIPWLQHARLLCPSHSSHSLLKLMSIMSVMPSKHLILCQPLFLLPSIFPSIMVFSNKSALRIRWPNIGVSASASVLPVNTQDWSPLGWAGWISFLSRGLSRAFSNTNSKPSILWRSAFFMVQVLHPYMTTGKTIALTRWKFVAKVMFLLFNKLSRLVIAFLTRNKCHWISWLQSPSAMILEPPKNKVSHCFYCFPIYLPWSDGTRCHDLSFLNVELEANFFTLLFYFHQHAL